MESPKRPKMFPIAKATGSIPSDAIMLTESEALDMQWKVVTNWKPRRDVWPFTVGIGSLGAVAGLTGFLANQHYRKRLRLFNHGKLSSYIPLVFLPSIIATFLHYEWVSRDIVLYKKVCPVCMETRAMALQAFCGIIYPMAMAPAATFHLANRIYTYPIPPISKDLVKTYVKLTKPFVPKLILMAMLNVGLAMMISFEEVQSIHKINKKMEAMYNLQEQRKRA